MSTVIYRLDRGPFSGVVTRHGHGPFSGWYSYSWSIGGRGGRGGARTGGRSQAIAELNARCNEYFRQARQHDPAKH